MAPWLQSELEPNIPGSTHPGTRPAAQPAEPKWLPVLGSARAPLDLVPELPHEILVRNNDQGGNPHRRNSDSGRFYWAPWKASLYQPGKPLDPKESNGTWNGPRRIGVEESIRLVEPMSGRSGNRGMTADRITNIGILPKGCYFPGPTAARS